MKVKVKNKFMNIFDHFLKLTYRLKNILPRYKFLILRCNVYIDKKDK